MNTRTTISHQQYRLMNKAWSLYNKSKDQDVLSRAALNFRRTMDRLETLPRLAVEERIRGGMGWEKL